MSKKNKKLLKSIDFDEYIESLNHALEDYEVKKSLKGFLSNPELFVETPVTADVEISLEDLFTTPSHEIVQEPFSEPLDAELGGMIESFKKRASKSSKQAEDTNDLQDAGELDLTELLFPKDEVAAPKKEAAKPVFSNKEDSKRTYLYQMEASLTDVVPIIRHDDGVYYYNGKCYVALRNDMELLELVRTKVSKTAFSLASTKPFQDLLVFLKTDPLLVPEDYEKKLRKARRLVALNNGVLDISDLKLKEFHPKYLLFHSIDASWTTGYPKTFMRFIRQSCLYDEEIVRLVLEMIGYILAGNNEAKVFFVLGTARDSGKSTLGNFLQKLIGEEFVSAISSNQLHERFAMGSTRGKILNLALDIPKGKLCPVAVSRIKSITGGDPIRIEEKYLRAETTKSSLRFILGTNHPITLSKEDGDDEAFWQRMIVVPFMKTVDPEERDVHLLEKLWDERDKIVSLCLRSYQTVMNNGFVFSHCQAGEDLKASWRRDDASSYSFACFWTDHVEVTGNMGDQVYAQTLYSYYCMFCQDRDFGEPVYYTKMREWIEAHVDPDLCVAKRIHKTATNPRSGYCGIKINY